ESHRLFHSLLTGTALPAVIVSALAGIGALALVYTRRFEQARYGAALAVAAIIAGWALARWPTILPGLTVYQAAAGHDTLVAVVLPAFAGAVIPFPPPALLFRLTLTGRFTAESTISEGPAQGLRPVRPGPLARSAAACLIAGFGLLNVAEAGW